jgi:hypothetical protein
VGQNCGGGGGSCTVAVVVVGFDTKMVWLEV